MKTSVICETCLATLKSESEALAEIYAFIAKEYSEEAYILGYHDYPSPSRTTIKHLEVNGYIVTTEEPTRIDVILVRPVIQQTNGQELVCKGH